MTYRITGITTTLEAPEDVAPHQDGEAFRVTIRTQLTTRELRRHSAPAKDWDDLKAMYAPLVIAWGLDVPPPAEGGPDQFDELPMSITAWLIKEVSSAVLAQTRAATQALHDELQRRKVSTTPIAPPLLDRGHAC